MNPPRVRLVLGAVYWRLASIVFIVGEWNLWRKVGRGVRVRQPLLRVHYWIGHSPDVAFRALLIAGIATLIAAVVVRCLVRPWVARRLSPVRPGIAWGTPYEFLLEPNERVLAESPARRGSLPGDLVLTSHRVWFFPHAWDVEPWALSLARVRDVRTTPTPHSAWGLIQGLPDRIVICAGPGERQTFIVADPDLVLSWFETPARTDR